MPEEETTSTLDKLTLNNFIVQNRPTACRGKVHIINKLIKFARKLRQKKAHRDQDKIKFTKKADDFMQQVMLLKGLHADDITKFALLNKKSFSSVVSDPNCSTKEKALVRVVEYKVIKTSIDQFKEQHSNWAKDVPLLIKGLGLRHRSKKLGKLKDKGKLAKYLEKEQRNLKLLQELTDIDINPLFFKGVPGSTKVRAKDAAAAGSAKTEAKVQQNTSRKRKRERGIDIKIRDKKCMKTKHLEEGIVSDGENRKSETFSTLSLSEGDRGKLIKFEDNSDDDIENFKNKATDDDDDDADDDNDDDDDDGDDGGGSTSSDDNEMTDGVDCRKSDFLGSHLGSKIEQKMNLMKQSIDDNEDSEEEDDDDEDDDEEEEEEVMMEKKSDDKGKGVCIIQSKAAKLDSSQSDIAANIATGTGIAVVKQLDLTNFDSSLIEVDKTTVSDSEDEGIGKGTKSKERRRGRKKSSFFLGSKGRDSSSGEGSGSEFEDGEEDRWRNIKRIQHYDGGSGSEDDVTINTAKYFKRNLFRGPERNSDRDRGRGQGRHRGDGRWNKEYSERRGRDFGGGDMERRSRGFDGGDFERRGKGFDGRDSERRGRGFGGGDFNRDDSHMTRGHSRRGRGHGNMRGHFGRGWHFDDSSNPNLMPVAPRRNDEAQPKAGTDQMLHPSWAAKRLEKEKTTSVQFAGKRMVFDMDD